MNAGVGPGEQNTPQSQRENHSFALPLCGTQPRPRTGSLEETQGLCGHQLSPSMGGPHLGPRPTPSGVRVGYRRNSEVVRPQAALRTAMSAMGLRQRV